MKNCYYGDNLDLKKWSTVLELAHLGHRIFYVAMYSNEKCPSEINGRVWSHFRNLPDICDLDPRIDFFDVPFTHRDRDEYFSQVRSRLSAEERGKTVLLDPNTGIAPQNYTDNHVTLNEIAHIWETLQVGDILAIYQHKDRTPDCFTQKKQLLQQRLNTTCEVKDFKNVAFLICKR